MSKIVIEENHEYVICTESIISSYDRKILTRLYQPLIGSIAFALYETFLSEFEFDKTVTSLKRPFKSLTKIMNVGIDDFRLALSKLEGTGLIKSLFNKKENYFLIELFSPNTPSSFFDSPLLDSKLHKQLGNDEYQRTKQYFSFAIISKTDFEDVSNSYNDVYDFDINAIFNGSTNQVSKKRGSVRLSFDQEAFDLRIKELQISKSHISKDDLENIIMYANCYNIASVDMADIVARSLNSEGHIDIMMLKKLSESKMNGNVNVKTISTIKNTGNMKLDELITYYNMTNSKQFLLSKNNGSPILPSQLTLIESLRNIYKFSDGIINCLLDYVLNKNDGKISNAYVETIASSMKRGNVSDTYNAYEYLYKTKAKQSKQEEKDTNSNQVSDKDIEESLRKLEEFRRKRENGEN